MLFSVAAGSAAANTLTNYHDKDIDAIMERTKDRPLPSKRIYPAVKARNFGLALAGISLVLAFAISFTTTLEQGIWATVFIAFGIRELCDPNETSMRQNGEHRTICESCCGRRPARESRAQVGC